MEQINPHNIPAFQRKKSIQSIEKKLNKKNIRLNKSKKLKPTRKINQNDSDIPINEEDPIEEEFKKVQERLKKKEVREMKICGQCEAYFDTISVAVINVTSSLKKGDQLLFETAKGLFEQPINSMQKNRKDINIARCGDEIGVKVAIPPKVGGAVYKEI